MTYPDNGSNSVHSLLALLRSAQDGPTSTGNPNPISSSSVNTPAQIPGQPPIETNRPNIPSKRQLDDLLASLNAQPPSSGQAEASRRSSLIEPFGPVGQPASPSEPPYEPQSSIARRNSTILANGGGRMEGNAPPRKKRKPSERVDEEGYTLMTFSKALPILSELLEDESFKSELKKMKKEQDTLERRLWAKGEKVKAEHEKSIQAEKQIAKIARKVIPPEKKEMWNKALDTSFNTFILEQCLPAIDGLAMRQRQRLIELGVPGLGDDGEKGKDRIKRIMELLEAGLEE